MNTWMGHLPQAARGIGGGGHGGSAATVGCVGRNLDRCGVREANARIQLQMIFAARGAISFTCVFVAQASQLIASADAVAVAGFRSGFNGHERHFEGSFAVMLHEIADLGKHRRRDRRDPAIPQ